MGRRLLVAIEIAVIVFVVVLAAAIWILIHAVDATGRLSDARLDISRVRADLVAGRSATTDMAAAQRDARGADHDTHDVVWDAVSWLPPVHTVRGITSAVDDLAKNALPPVVQIGPRLQPSRLRVARNRIALAPLRAAAPVLQRAAAATIHARDEVASLPGGWVGLISTARDKLLSELTSLSGSVDDASRFATVGPSMLGQDGTRRYFVGIQNNAESRATGGLVAAYAIVTADHGTIRVVQHGNDSALGGFFSPTPTVDLGADYNNEYGNYLPAQRWITSNDSPNFPDAGDIWAHLWQAEYHQHIDGSFGVDPVALQSMLGAAGPVTVPGYPGVYTGQNLAQFIEQTEYAEFPGLGNPLRKAFVGKVASAVLHKLLSGSGDPQTIATALGNSAGGGHLELWSGHPDEQAEISGTPLAGELSRTTAPFASVNFDNATGSKLDYYLDRTLTYQAGSCSGSRRTATITVTLDNDAPLHGLPAYVRVRGDIGTVESVPRSRLFVFIHATDGAALLRATIDGRTVQVSPGVELGHPVYMVELLLDPQVPKTIRLELNEPTAAGRPSTQVQPMARPQRTVFDAPICH